MLLAAKLHRHGRAPDAPHEQYPEAQNVATDPPQQAQADADQQIQQIQQLAQQGADEADDLPQKIKQRPEGR